MLAISIKIFLGKLSKKIRWLLPKDHFARSTVILAGGTTFAQALAVVFAPVLTRLYFPNDFGMLAVYASILAISLNFASFRYEFAIPLPQDNKTAMNVLVLCIALIFITSSLFGLGYFVFYDELMRFERISSFGQYIWLLPIGLIFAGFYQVFNYWAVRERIYPTIARTRISQGIASVLTQLGFGIFKFGSLGLLLGQIIGESVGSGTLARQFWKQNRKNMHSITFTTLYEAAYRYKNFPLYQSSASLLNSAGMHIPSLLFATYYGTEVAGWFFLTQKVLAMPISLVGTSVSKVFWGEAARLSREPLKLRKLYRKVNAKLFIYGLFPSMVLAIGGQWIFKFVFGPAWVQSGVFVQVMAFMYLLKFTTDSAISFSIIERQDLSFLWSLMRLIFVVLGIMCAIWYELPEFWAVVFFSITMAASYIIKYAMWGCAVRQLIATKGIA